MLSESDLYCKKKITSRIVESVKNYYRKMMELPDSPQKIACGVAMGLSFDFLPIPIISIPLSYLVARLIRCNPVAAVATVVFFKLAVPFFYTLDLLTGNALLGSMTGPDIAIAGDNMFSPLLSGIAEHGYPFLAGSLVNAVAVFLPVYFLLKYLLKRKQRKGV
ncbi:DUF2062 domain-containing protein [Pelotomaculum isophthalicicum JI]|uniref:DUF2062 domain-containing protein n=1 Tax=Pelotomaculum isophthalicicum JI TaxID=947010 RepID=A0A9X4GYC0_9FIRM|nr:DUF2062 domain-containing protein [Pelotomaculum isophthalicicum]MDF9407612.1 DUF2062 domain-containing protein [Pelotomaculum isophthalicicum JI]